LIDSQSYQVVWPVLLEGENIVFVPVAQSASNLAPGETRLVEVHNLGGLFDVPLFRR
jgi:hypothetical protein